MADRGLCSRREADVLIARGWVRVDGEPVSILGYKIRPDQDIQLMPEARSHLRQSVTILLNKPLGYVSGQPEKGYPTALSLIKPENRFPGDRLPWRWQPAHLRQLAAAGRLDINSQGLLVLTQDGRIARQLIGSASRVDKEYLVRFRGEITPRVLSLLEHGLFLDNQPLRKANVRLLNPDQLQLVLWEGKKRQIRRMCERVGLEVLQLKRVRIGAVRLGNLPQGKWRYLRPDEKF